METATRTLPEEFRHIDPKTARVILVERGDRLLRGMPEEMGFQAQPDFEAMRGKKSALIWDANAKSIFYAKRILRIVWAFIATITVLSDINSAPSAGESKNPKGARMPAARGKATTL